MYKAARAFNLGAIQVTRWQRLIRSLIFIRHFPQNDLYLVALLWKVICSIGDSMSLRHPVVQFVKITHHAICKKHARNISKTYCIYEIYTDHASCTHVHTDTRSHMCTCDYLNLVQRNTSPCEYPQEMHL